MYLSLVKPFFDKILSIFVLLVFLPIYVIVSICILCIMGRPILFSQSRIGYGEKEFKVLKFRTMKNREDFPPDTPSRLRLTKFGLFLRRTSLDEIPQIFNIIKGDMSFIGPRPLLPEYLPLYSEKHKKRHSVKPGITGLAQVNGRNRLSWTEKFDLDVAYVKEVSLMTDIKILIKTLLVIFSGSDITPKNKEISERFNGKN